MAPVCEVQRLRGSDSSRVVARRTRPREDDRSGVHARLPRRRGGLIGQGPEVAKSAGARLRNRGFAHERPDRIPVCESPPFRRRTESPHPHRPRAPRARSLPLRCDQLHGRCGKRPGPVRHACDPTRPRACPLPLRRVPGNQASAAGGRERRESLGSTGLRGWPPRPGPHRDRGSPDATRVRREVDRQVPGPGSFRLRTTAPAIRIAAWIAGARRSRPMSRTHRSRAPGYPGGSSVDSGSLTVDRGTARKRPTRISISGRSSGWLTQL